MGPNVRRFIGVLLLGVWILLLSPHLASANEGEDPAYPRGDITFIQEGAVPSPPSAEAKEPSWWDRLWNQVGGFFQAIGDFFVRLWRGFQDWWRTLPNWGKGLVVGIVAALVILAVVLALIIAGVALPILAIVAIVGAVVGVIAAGLWYGFLEKGEFSILKAALWVTVGGVLGAGLALLLWTVGPAVISFFGRAVTFLGRVLSFLWRALVMGWRGTKFWPTLFKAFKTSFVWVTLFDLIDYLRTGELPTLNEFVIEIVITVIFNFGGKLIEAGIPQLVSKKMAKRLFSKEFLGVSLKRISEWLRNGVLKLRKWNWFETIYQARNGLGKFLRGFTDVLYTPWKAGQGIVRWISVFAAKRLRGPVERLVKWISQLYGRLSS